MCSLEVYIKFWRSKGTPCLRAWCVPIYDLTDHKCVQHKQTMDTHVGCYGTMHLYTQLHVSAMLRVHKFMEKMGWVDKGKLPCQVVR